MLKEVVAEEDLVWLLRTQKTAYVLLRGSSDGNEEVRPERGSSELWHVR